MTVPWAQGANESPSSSSPPPAPTHSAAVSTDISSPAANTLIVPVLETLAWAVLPASAVFVPEIGDNAAAATSTSSYVRLLPSSHVGASDWTAVYCSSSLRGALKRVPEVFRAGSSTAVLVAVEVGEANPVRCFVTDRSLFPLDNARSFQCAVNLRNELNKSYFEDKLRPEDPLLPSIGRDYHMAVVFREHTRPSRVTESEGVRDTVHAQNTLMNPYCECAVPYNLFENSSDDSNADSSPLLKARLVARLKRDDLHEERVQFIVDAISGAEIAVSEEEKYDMDKLADRCRDPSIDFDSYLDAFFDKEEASTPQRRLQFSPIGDFECGGITTTSTTEDIYSCGTDEANGESPVRNVVDDGYVKSALKQSTTGKALSREDSGIRKVTISEEKRSLSPTESYDTEVKNGSRRQLTNSIIASDGNEYHIEPHCLPPPREIAKFLRDLQAKRDQGYFRMTPAKPPPPTPMVRNQEVRGEPFSNWRSGRASSDAVTKSSSSDYGDANRPAKKMTGEGEKSKVADETSSIAYMESSCLKDYLLDELFGVNALNSGVEDMINNEDADTRSQANIETFIGVPPLLERLIWFGMAVCLESFLYVITILLLRSVYSLLSLLLESRHGSMSKIRNIRTHMFNICRGGLVAVGCMVLTLFNMSRVYHVIRTQNTIKLYAFTSMLEVFDRLLGSFGQDALQYLHAATRRASDQTAAQYLRKIVFAFAVAAIYVAIHSSVYFVHIATLTVAVNTADKALITVLIINNFAEIKSFAFKKFDKEALFIMSCSDITERFQIFLFFILIAGLGVLHSDATSWTEHFVSFSNVLLFMFGAEMLADWIKHAFVAKFNKIGPSIYKKYARILRADISYYRKESIMLDYTHSICRRIGLAQIPLACLFFRFVILALHTPSMLMWQESISNWRFAFYGVAVFAATVLFKIAVSRALFSYVRRRFQQDQIEGQSDGLNKDVIERLATIEKYTALKPPGDSPEPKAEFEKSK